METNNTPAFDTVVEALGWLSSNGYSHDFNRNDDYTKKILQKGKDFTVQYIFRFEGSTDPADEHILYGISSDSQKVKGVILNAFGVYADIDAFAIINKFIIKNRVS